MLVLLADNGNEAITTTPWMQVNETRRVAQGDVWQTSPHVDQIAQKMAWQIMAYERSSREFFDYRGL
jgi:hypothetical protein